MTTLDLSHQRAVGDLLQAERSLRQKSEETVRAMRQALVETANRFDGKRLEALRRDDPSVPDRWSAADWKMFFDKVSMPSQGWVVNTMPDENLQRRIAQLQEALALAERNLQEEKEKNAAAVVLPDPVQKKTAPVKDPGLVDAIGKIPNAAMPALSVIIEDAKGMLLKYPKKVPAAFNNILSGGERSGGDLVRAFQRYWLILYLVGRWRLAAAMEIEQALGEVVNVMAGSGSMRRLMIDLEEAGVLTSKVLNLYTPRTALKLCRLSPMGGKLFQALFESRPYEDDWSRLIRLHEGERFPQHTLAVIAFTMHARKRGWATQVLPEVTGSKAVPDAWVMRENEKLYVEVELGDKERVSKWRNQASLNNGRVALCAGTQKTCARLVGDCKLDHLPGLATDLETLVNCKYKEITSAIPLWLESWK